jgi:hypothetical protein
LVAGVCALRLIVQADRACGAAGQGEFRSIHTYPAQQAMQAFVSGVVGISRMAGRYRDLGDAGVLPVVVPVVNASG